MASKRKKPASPELTQSWLRHRADLQSLITSNPNDASTWLWAIRIKILDFLLHQYTEYDADSLAEQSNDDQAIQDQPVRNKESDLSWSLPQTPVPVRHASQVRSLLHDIHDANIRRQEESRQHFEALEQERQESMQRIREQLKAEVERKREKLRKRLAKAEKRRLEEQAIRDAVVNLSYPEEPCESRATETAVTGGVNEEHDRCVNDNLSDIRAMIDQLELIGPSDEPLTDDEIVGLMEL